MRLPMLAWWLYALIMLGLAMPANASVLAKVDISSQTMTVFVDGSPVYVWPVSTARRGYYTPRGSFRPEALELMHYSSKYESSPMPHSIFFDGGYAIHGTLETRYLGRPASHGYIRLSPDNAATLYGLVRRDRDETKIVVGD
jgi:lipoprotein-anchoring transpeptidase ErfK/SrfK